MQPMRRILPRPTLRMADGGVITRWAQNIMRPTQTRLRAADAPTPVAAPVAAAPPVQTAAPVTPDNPAGIRFADGGHRYAKGSQSGGRVVGQGNGISDSVPARYSTGEYVLPADTAKQIGYDELDAIKDATHTPAAVQRELRNGADDVQKFHAGNSGRGEAGATGSGGMGDQSGVRGGDSVHPLEQVKKQTLRLADGGLEPYVNHRRYSGAPAYTPPAPSSAVGPATYRPNFTTPSPTPGTAVGPATYQPNFTTPDATRPPTPGARSTFGATDAIPKTPGEAAHGERINPSPKPDGRYGAPANPTAAPAAPTAAPTARVGMAGQTGVLGKTSYVAGRAVNAVGALAASPLGKAAGGAGVVESFNDYKINDPDVDSSLRGTGAAIGRDFYDAWNGGGNTYPQTRASLSKGMLETGMDLGSFAAKTADLAGYLPGVEKGFATKAYDKFLRNQFGDQLAPNASTPGLAGSAPAAPAPQTTTPVGYNTPGADATMPGQDPGRGPMLRGQTGTELAGAPGVSKFTQNGKTLYSNVTTPGDNDKLMSNKPGVSVVPGMSREAVDSALGGLSASQVSGDNAIRAANLRDGVDMERGTQGGKAAEDERRLQELAMSPAGTNGRTFAQKQLGLRMADATTRRSQDITERGNIMQNEASLRNNKATRDAAARTADREQGNSDRTFNAGRDDARFTQREKSEKDLTESILQSHTSTVDGKSVVDQKAANQTRQAFDTMIAKQIQDLQRSGAPADLARAKNLADNKVNAIDPATRQKVIAAVKLMNKVGADGSNLNWFKPDHMGTSDPRDFMDLKKNSSGDYVTRNGKVIEARYFNKQDADRFGGVPTNEFDILKGQ